MYIADIILKAILCLIVILSWYYIITQLRYEWKSYKRSKQAEKLERPERIHIDIRG